MSNNSLCALLILAFLQSGKSKTDVSISHRPYRDRQNVTCILSGDENMTQINWERKNGPNRTKLGTFHPSFGIHIPQEFLTEVQIHGKPSRPPLSSLLIKAVLNESVLICCAFVTFPSGKLEQCTDISQTDASVNTDVVKDFSHMQRETGMGLYGRLGAMIIGSILSLFTLTFFFILCRKNNCRRKKSFEIRVRLTDIPAETQEEELPPSCQSSSNGFDPSKLYAKIKKDLFYGRLWKSYQGQPKEWTQDHATDQRHVYHLLGQSPLPQRNTQILSATSDTTQ